MLGTLVSWGSHMAGGLGKEFRQTHRFLRSSARLPSSTILAFMGLKRSGDRFKTETLVEASCGELVG